MGWAGWRGGLRWKLLARFRPDRRPPDDTEQLRKLPESLKVDSRRKFARAAVDRQNRRLGLAEVGLGPPKWRHVLHGGETDHEQLVRDDQTSTPAAASNSLRNVDSLDFL